MCELCLEFSGKIADDRVLKCGNIRHFACVPLSPHLRTVRNPDEVGFHVNFIAVLRDAAGQNALDREILANLSRIFILVLETKYRRSGENAKFRQLCEAIYDVLSEAVAQKFPVRIPGGVHKRQDSHGLHCGSCTTAKPPPTCGGK